MTKKMITVYLIFLVMSTVFSPVVYAQEEEETPVYKTPFTCTVDSISAEEVEKFQDMILKEGFRGAEISSGTPANEFREELENNTAILSPDQDKNTGLKVDLPNEKMDIDEVNYLLNNRYTGAFALGILINDTLRAGRCLEWNEAECAAMGKNLTLRNSGTGISGDFKNIWNDIKKTIDGNQGHSFSEKDLSRLNDIFQVEDQNEIMAEGYSRIPMNYMINSIMTDSLDASMATNCNDSSCRISIYSLFDKYYNSWYSGEMVVSVFAPVLWGQAKHIFGVSYRRGFFGRKWLPDIEHSSLVKNYRKKLFGPDAFWSKTRADKARNIFKKYDMHAFYNEWIEGTYFKEGMAATDAAEKLMIKYFGKDGLIKGMKSVEAQKEFMQAVLELHRYNTACKQISEEASDALARKLNLAEQMPEDAARLVRRQGYEEYGAIEADLAAAYDYYWDADFPAMLAIQERNGLFYNAFRDARTGEFMHIPSSQDQFNEIMYNYVGRGRYEPAMMEPGKVKGMWGQFGAEEVENGALKLYKFDSRAGIEVTTIGKQDLKEHVLKGQYRELFAKLDNGEMMPVKNETVEHILQRVEGDIHLFEGYWKFDRLLTPEDTGRVMRSYMHNRVSKSQEMT
ncbi:hypothetical protein KJ660_01155, partial [Candidatus Micrarchaeota archaeon]|nr:hypothetical protein [Candidatus Micrarchaeota archaeon]